jgi:hypothetical protein
MLRNAEISKALLRISATLVVTSREARSPTAIRHLVEDYAKDFRRLISANQAKLDKHSDPPFAILHESELQ